MEEEKSLNWKALNKVADYLGRRDHSVKELYTKLSKHFDHENIEWALLEAQSQGWITPPDELAVRVTQELHQKKKGYRFICNFLKKRGLPTPSKDDEREFEKAEALLEAKMNKKCDFSYEEKQKAYRFLSNRGFDDSTIKKVIYG